MKKVIKSILKNMIFYALILSAIFIFSKKIINSYDMEFRNWFYFAIISLIFFLFIIGIIQIICKLKDLLIKIFIILTLLVFIGISLSITYFLCDILVQYEEKIVNKQGKKFVGHIYSFVTTKIEYYEYINSILRGKDIVLYEELEK